MYKNLRLFGCVYFFIDAIISIWNRDFDKILCNLLIAVLLLEAWCKETYGTNRRYKTNVKQDTITEPLQNIKPCPFCGSEGATTYNTQFGFQVFCTSDECFMNEVIMTNIDTEEKAIEIWNKRRKENE